MTHSELAGSYALSLLVRRQRPSQPNVRVITHRRRSTRKPVGAGGGSRSSLTQTQRKERLTFFAAIDHVKPEHNPLVLSYVRVLYADENAIFRHKMYMARIRRFTP
jgi:hypothetical protein